MELSLSIGGFVLTVASLIYAIITSREKAKLQKLVEVRLENMIESVKDIKDNTELAYRHTNEIRRFLNGVNQSDELKTMLDRATWAQGDITTAHRMLNRLKHDISSLQHTLFDTEIAQHRDDALESVGAKDVVKDHALPTVSADKEKVDAA